MLAHEIGHALGMKHDFKGRKRIRTDSNGNRCTSENGIMGYGDDGDRSQIDRFSTCSKEDFARWHNKVVDKHGYFCLTNSKYKFCCLIYIPVSWLKYHDDCP